MRIALYAVATAALLVAACGGSEPSALPQGAEPVTLDPAEFTTEIDNEYWPMRPGSKWVYRETDGEGNVQRIEVTVTDSTRTVAGVEARVVHDVVTEDGAVVEDTYDWYAQDREGNVWYLGEDTKEYEDGKLKSTAGSWQTGVDGAQAGVVVPADPEVGLAYREEYLDGEAEDRAEIVNLDGQARVPYGSFDDVLVTRGTTPLEPDVVERKYYAKGIGPVLAVTVGGGREVLVEFTRG